MKQEAFQKKSPITFFSVAELIPSKEKLTIANIFTNFRPDWIWILKIAMSKSTDYVAIG